MEFKKAKNHIFGTSNLKTKEKPRPTNNFCAAACVHGVAKGGKVTSAWGPSWISGKLKIIYLVHLNSKLKKTHVLQITLTSLDWRAQGVANGG